MIFLPVVSGKSTSDVLTRVQSAIIELQNGTPANLKNLLADLRGDVEILCDRVETTEQDIVDVSERLRTFEDTVNGRLDALEESAAASTSADAQTAQVAPPVGTPSKALAVRSLRLCPKRVLIYVQATVRRYLRTLQGLSPTPSAAADEGSQMPEAEKDAQGRPIFWVKLPDGKRYLRLCWDGWQINDVKGGWPDKIAEEIRDNGEQFHAGITADECRKTPLPLIKLAMKTAWTSWRQTRNLSAAAQDARRLRVNEAQRRRAVRCLSLTCDLVCLMTYRLRKIVRLCALNARKLLVRSSIIYSVSAASSICPITRRSWRLWSLRSAIRMEMSRHRRRLARFGYLIRPAIGDLAYVSCFSYRV